MTDAGQTQRIDKWLWHARVVKTRSLAQKLVTAGKVRVDRERVTSSSFKLRQGNVLTITLERSIKILEVTDLVEKRGSFEIASQTYIDHSPVIEKTNSKDPAMTGSPEKNARPSKNARREAIRLKQNSSHHE